MNNNNHRAFRNVWNNSVALRVKIYILFSSVYDACEPIMKLVITWYLCCQRGANKIQGCVPLEFPLHLGPLYYVTA